MRILMILLLSVGLAHAEGEKAGDFDYYVLALSWSPNWCALEGKAKGSEQCDDDAKFGWVMHGLWPQFEQGYPSYCRTSHRDPSRAQSKAMAQIMGSSGSAWYQWKKHGRCAGLSAADYYSTATKAYFSVTRPDVFRRLSKPVKLPAKVVEQAFLKENPDLRADMLTITCKANQIQEARVCLNKDLTPRVCGSGVRRDCQMKDAAFMPLNP